MGWGHSGLADTIAFARLTGARRLSLFHHDPLHDDAALDALGAEAAALAGDGFEDVSMAREQQTVTLAT